MDSIPNPDRIFSIKCDIATLLGSCCFSNIKNKLVIVVIPEAVQFVHLFYNMSLSDGSCNHIKRNIPNKNNS